MADPELVRRPDVYAGESDYTPEAWASLQDFRSNWDSKIDDPPNFCVRYGMPNAMVMRARTYMFDISQSASRITVLIEYMDNFRLIHLGQTAVPDGVLPSNNGYSIGHFEGETLVIETSALKARPAAGPVQRSTQARFVERWRLKTDPGFGRIIDIDITEEDPKTFRHPMKAREVLKVADEGAQMNEYGCADALWEDHVAHVKAAQASDGKK